MFHSKSFKLCLLYLLFFTAHQVCQSQQESTRISSWFLTKSTLLPADKVYLHLDRNLYHPDDTIRFQAYIKDRQTGIFETKSISLYCLLVNSSGLTVDSSRFRIINSTSSGWLKVPATIITGNYTVIAFTGDMMNYDPGYVFTTPVRIDRLLPAESPPASSPEKAFETSYQLSLPQPQIDLRFLPEGGTFICGINQRVAFNAVTSTGKTLDVAGTIVNRHGEKVASFRSGSYGPGITEITPSVGDTLTAIMEGDMFPGLKWKLPVPSENGVSLKARNEPGVLEISVEGRNTNRAKYILALSMNNVLVLSGEVRSDSLQTFRINTDALPIGTAYITLFDKELTPVAERLVLVNSHRKLNIEIITSAWQYNRGEETELMINSVDNNGNNASSIISVSVIDSLSGYHYQLPANDIKSSMLFESEFVDNLPPKIRLRGLSGMDDDNIDLLLMTYGWRTFRVKEPEDTVMARELRHFDCLKITSPAPGKKTRDEIKVMTIEGSEIISLKPGANGESLLEFDKLGSSARQIMIMPDNNPSKNLYPVLAEFPENKIFTDGAKKIKYGYDFSSTDIPLQKSNKTDFGLDSAIIIEPVTIRGEKPKTERPVSKYELRYQHANISTLYKEDFKGALNFEDILVRMHLYRLDTRQKLAYTGPNRAQGIRGSLRPALIVVDDNPLFVPQGTGTWVSGYGEIAEMPADHIESVSVLKGLQGFTIYGQDALGGVIFVTTRAQSIREGTYREEGPSGPPVKTDLAKPIRIFRSEIEYYIPKKEEAASNPQYQYRTTLLWENEIILDGNGPVSIRFPNNMVRGSVMVFVSGVSFNNIPGSGFQRYTVK